VGVGVDARGGRRTELVALDGGRHASEARAGGDGRCALALRDRDPSHHGAAAEKDQPGGEHDDARGAARRRRAGDVELDVATPVRKGEGFARAQTLAPGEEPTSGWRQGHHAGCGAERDGRARELIVCGFRALWGDVETCTCVVRPHDQPDFVQVRDLRRCRSRGTDHQSGRQEPSGGAEREHRGLRLAETLCDVCPPGRRTRAVSRGGGQRRPCASCRRCGAPRFRVRRGW